MLDQFKKLLGQSAIYGLGLVASGIATLILTPLFLHRLSKSEYGMLEILSVYTSMIATILLLGMASVLIKVYLNDCNDEQERKQLVTSMVAFSGVAAILIVLLSSVFSGPLSGLLLKGREHAPLIRLAACSGGLLLVQQITMTCLRAKQWPGKFVTISLLHLALMISLSIYLVWSRHMGVVGILLATVFAHMIALSMGLVMVRSDLAAGLSMKIVKHVLRLSIPLFPMTMAPWVLNVSDRYFLNQYAGLSDTGLYAVGYKIGMTGMFLLINAFQYAWGPFYFASSDGVETPRLCANVLKYYVLVLVASGLAFSLFAPEILRVIAKREFWGADWIVPYIALSYVFHGIQFFSIPFFIKVDRGILLNWIMCGAAILNLSLNFLLIPAYGIRGAVAATLSTFMLQAVVSLAMATRVYHVPHQYGNIAKVFALAVVAYVVLAHVSAVPGVLLALKLASFPILALALLGMGFLNRKELDLMQSIPGKVRRRLVGYV